MPGTTDLKLLMEVAEIMAAAPLDGIEGLPAEDLRRLERAAILSRQALGMREPSLNADPEVWFAGPEDGVDKRHFYRGPAPSLADLGRLSEGDIIIGMSAAGVEVARGKVGPDQVIDWSCQPGQPIETAADNTPEP